MGNPASENVRDISTRLRACPLDELPELIERYRHDPRSGVSKAVAYAQHRLEEQAALLAHTQELYDQQREVAGDCLAIGIDEVGRGAVAGPLTVAAVALPDRPIVVGIDDSKKLSPRLREGLASEIRRHALAIGIAHVPPADIDRDGMALSLRRAMTEALANAGVESDVVLVDGNPMHLCPQEVAVVHGDARIACVAAASIIAKVARDACMVAADERYPGYGFALSKGYGTADHIAAIRRLGLSEFHRSTFCQGFLSRQGSLFDRDSLFD